MPGGPLSHSLVYSLKFNLILKQQTASILAIPDILKIFPVNVFMVPEQKPAPSLIWLPSGEGLFCFWILYQHLLANLAKAPAVL